MLVLLEILVTLTVTEIIKDRKTAVEDLLGSHSAHAASGMDLHLTLIWEMGFASSLEVPVLVTSANFWSPRLPNALEAAIKGIPCYILWIFP